MTLQLPLTKDRRATLISAYTHTMTNRDESKDKFYEDLETTIARVPPAEKLIILGDFNARVGADRQKWEGVIGMQGIGKCNSNGLLLLNLCSTHELTITNTLFRLPNRNKTSWMHPMSKHWHLIDYVITRKRDRQDVRVTKAICGAECWTDHRLIASKLNLQIQPKRRPQGKKTARRLDIARLENPDVLNDFTNSLGSKLSSPQPNQVSIEDQWKTFRDTVHTTAEEHLGPSIRKHQGWFDENDVAIKTLLDEKQRLLKVHQNDPTSTTKKAAFTGKRKEVQIKLREIQDHWLSRKADEIQRYVDSNDSKRFYDALKSLYGPQPSGTSPLLSADGTTLLTEKSQILNRWAEHFDSVLNRPSPINDDAISRLPQVETNPALDHPPTAAEVKEAIDKMPLSKAPGSDSIPAEIYKSGGPAMIQELASMFQAMWNEGKLPQEFRDATVVHIYKRKGNRQSCDNHRRIFLLCIEGKILARVLLNRLLQHLERGLLPES